MTHTRDTIYVDGSWIPSTGTGTLPVTNPFTEEVIGQVPDGTAEDVDKAVQAAARAFETWSQVSLEERVKYCTRIAEGLQARQQEIALSAATGMPRLWAAVHTAWTSSISIVRDAGASTNTRLVSSRR